MIDSSKYPPGFAPRGDRTLLHITPIPQQISGVPQHKQKLGESAYLPFVKKIIRGRLQVSLDSATPASTFDVIIKARDRDCSRIATTSPRLLAHLLDRGGKKKLPTIDDYAGSIIERHGYEFLILNPLEQLISKSAGKFIAERFWGKFIDPSSWLQLPAFEWSLFSPATFSSLFQLWRTAVFISIDIETTRNDPERSIACCGFSAIFFDHLSKSYRIQTVVIPFTDSYNVSAARQLCSLPAPKVLQNGKYDVAYLLRYNTPIRNYAFDTINLFHSWYSELPKSLGFLASFALRKWQFWKDEGKSSDLMEFYAYNAKDCYATAVILISLLREMPPWALTNYKMEFPLVFPCILSEATGILGDASAMKDMKKQLDVTTETEQAKLRIMVASPNYNPRSSQQTGKLFEMLGSGDIKSKKTGRVATGKIAMDKVASRHPLNKRIVMKIRQVREEKKLVSTYLKEGKLWNNRIYYALNPHGTDTSRLASKESQFWCGFQIQNIPRDRKDIQIKSAYRADPDFYLGEADYEQNEARGTGYLSGDIGLIAAVESDRDYHAINVERFFGVPYARVVDGTGKVIDKDLRDLSKRTNHGSNYNMGASVLLDTMGIENVLKARKILRLKDGRTLEEGNYTLIATCQFMLNSYEQAYPMVKTRWYEKCMRDVELVRMLIGPTGWTRFCFGSPRENKRDLNRYVAHPPQSLAAQLLNRAYLMVFHNVWLREQEDFKLHAQIHDSILFSYRKGREDLAWAVKREMELTTPVICSAGIKRDLFVPVALKGGAERWSELRDLKAAT